MEQERFQAVLSQCALTFACFLIIFCIDKIIKTAKVVSNAYSLTFRSEWTFISEIKNMAVTRKNTNKLDRVYGPDTNKTLFSRYCDPRMLSAFLLVGNAQ
jgi:hypothetical protein